MCEKNTKPLEAWKTEKNTFLFKSLHEKYYYMQYSHHNYCQLYTTTELLSLSCECIFQICARWRPPMCKNDVFWIESVELYTYIKNALLFSLSIHSWCVVPSSFAAWLMCMHAELLLLVMMQYDYIMKQFYWYVAFVKLSTHNTNV